MREYLVVIAVAWVATYLTTGLVRAAAMRFGPLQEVRSRDVHTVPTPRLGGFGMYLGFLAAMLVAGQMPMLHQWVFATSFAKPGLLWGSGLLVLLGVVDGQVFAASVMVLSGLQIDWLPIPGYGTLVLDPTSSAVLSILIVVVMINAVNFVDGLDGLAGGMCAIAAFVFFVYGYRLQHGYTISSAAPAVMVAAVVVGMCLGFLCHNWSPARIFMGDSGSMLLGLLLAATTILATGQIDPDLVREAAGSQSAATHKTLAVYIPLVLPFSCLALPMADMVMAVVRRTKAGRSPFSADKQHLHHRLLQIGHSKVRAVLIMYLWAVMISAAVIAFTVTAPHRPPIIVGMSVDAIALAVLLLPRARKHIDDRAERKAARHAAPGRRPADPAPASRSTTAQAPDPGAVPDFVPTGPPPRYSHDLPRR
jgi:UDP-GlcNAc:undecaprenyl-phosphate GlcNAc-1-phosphate transferase